MQSLQLITLIVYAVLATMATVVLSKSLHKNGEAYIANLLQHRPDLVKPINNILLIGFYLVNLAFVLLYLSKGNETVESLSQALGFLVSKLGFVFTVLGVWHYTNMILLLIIKHFLKKHKTWKTQI